MSGWGQQGAQQWGQQAPQWGQQQGWGQQGQGFNQGQNLFNPNSTYMIVTALDQNKVLDVSQNQDSNSKLKMIIYDKKGSPNQKYRFQSVGNGKYRIISLVGGTVQVPNLSTQNGIQISMSQPNNVQNQYWTITPAAGQTNAYTIKSFCGKVLDVCQGKTKNDTKVIQYDASPNTPKNQLWYIIPA